jgi:branched-chain amino acid transport system substrate-binding protein
MRRPVVLAALSAILAGGCASSPDGGIAEPPAIGTAEREALRSLDALVSEGSFIRAGELADSLFSEWGADPSRTSEANRALFVGAVALQTAGESEAAAARYETLIGRASGTLFEMAVGRLAEIWVRNGQDLAALQLLLDHPGSMSEESRRVMRQAAGSITLGELEELVASAGPGRAGGLLRAELARALALGGRDDSASVVARRVLDAEAWPSDRDLARRILEGGYREAARVRIGLLIPRSGRFAAAGELVEEGARIALQEYEQSAGALPIELIVVDDGSGEAGVVDLVRLLERDGVIAFIGPMRSEAFTEAAAGRRDDRLLMVSPTATDVQDPAENAFTLWARDRRHTDVARDVAQFLSGDAGLTRLGVLYPFGPLGQGSYQSFEQAARQTGANVVAASGYRPDTTTFQDPIGRLAMATPDAIFVEADAVPTVLQLTPQIPYYGIEGSIVAGSALWGAPEALRRLEGTIGNAWIVGAYVDRTAEASPWATFRDHYERAYRKSLRDNMLPALGYDAMRLILSALVRSGTADPARVARAAAELEIAGATGLFRLDPGTSTVIRRTLIRALRDGELRPLDVASLLQWRDAEAEEAARRAEAAEEEDG